MASLRLRPPRAHRQTGPAAPPTLRPWKLDVARIFRRELVAGAPRSLGQQHPRGGTERKVAVASASTATTKSAGGGLVKSPGHVAPDVGEAVSARARDERVTSAIAAGCADISSLVACGGRRDKRGIRVSAVHGSQDVNRLKPRVYGVHPIGTLHCAMRVDSNSIHVALGNLCTSRRFGPPPIMP